MTTTTTTAPAPRGPALPDDLAAAGAHRRTSVALTRPMAYHPEVQHEIAEMTPALTVSGGTGMFERNELQCLYLDVRCGGFHPASSLLTQESVGKTALGTGLGELPRWG
jgi:hypothetical protein